MVEAELDTEGNDLGLREVDQRRHDLGGMPLDPRLRGERREVPEGVEELRTAVGIAAVIDGVDADADRRRPPGFGKGQGEGKVSGEVSPAVGPQPWTALINS